MKVVADDGGYTFGTFFLLLEVVLYDVDGCFKSRNFYLGGRGAIFSDLMAIFSLNPFVIFAVVEDASTYGMGRRVLVFHIFGDLL